MKRYFLFDSNCGVCSRIAKELEAEMDGWLESKSLLDPWVRNYLDNNHPNWGWEPMILLQEQAEKGRLLTGFRMKLLLARKLGINKASKITRSIEQIGKVPLPNSRGGLSRRAFLQASVQGFMGAMLVFRAPQLLGNRQTVNSSQAELTDSRNDLGELYHGFVLLPAIDSPTPTYVDQPRSYTRISIPHLNEEDLRKAVPFALYKAGSEHTRLPLLNAQRCINEGAGATIGATINYGELAYYSRDLEEDRIISLIVNSKPYFLSPYPIRPVHAPNSAGNLSVAAPEKIMVGNAFGLLLPSSNGYVAYWIDQDVLYILAVEDSTDKETMRQVLDSLQKI